MKAKAWHERPEQLKSTPGRAPKSLLHGARSGKSCPSLTMIAASQASLLCSPGLHPSCIDQICSERVLLLFPRLPLRLSGQGIRSGQEPFDPGPLATADWDGGVLPRLASARPGSTPRLADDPSFRSPQLLFRQTTSSPFTSALPLPATPPLPVSSPWDAALLPLGAKIWSKPECKMTGSRNGTTDGSKYQVSCFLGLSLTIAILSGQG